MCRKQFFLWRESCLATFASLVSTMCSGMKESPMEHTEVGTETVDWNVNVVSQISALNGKGTVSIYTVCKVLIQWMEWATLLTVEFCWSQCFCPGGILQHRDSVYLCWSCVSRALEYKLWKQVVISNFSDFIRIHRVNHLNKLFLS